MCVLFFLFFFVLRFYSLFHIKTIVLFVSGSPMLKISDIVGYMNSATWQQHGHIIVDNMDIIVRHILGHTMLE